MSRKKFLKNYTAKDKILLIVLYILLGLFVVSIIVPLIYIFIASFMNPEKLINSGISFNIADYSLNGYKRVFEDPYIIKGYINSIIYS
ncbi:MAG: carbohydrate ABC transporter permease, partial [Eubacteriales bacterium]|nr:carbohydrate ABC transporter permease [Eubacteriales bacterium]